MSIPSTSEATERKPHLKKQHSKVIDRARWERYCDELLDRIAADQQALATDARHLAHLLEASRGAATPLFAWLQRLFGGGPVPGDGATCRLRLRALADLHRLTGDQLARLAGDVGALRALPEPSAAAHRERERAWRRIHRTVAGLAWHLETGARMAARARPLGGEARAVVCRQLEALLEGLEYKICWHFERV